MADPWRRYPLLTSGQSYRLKRFFLKNPWARPALAVVIAAILILAAYFIGKGIEKPNLEPFSIIESPAKVETKIVETVKTVEREVPGPGKVISYTGSDGYLVGGWGDHLMWDGMAVNPVNGEVIIKVDPDNNIGSVVAELKDVSINSEDRTFLKGNVSIEFNRFFASEDYQDGGIAQGIDLFGNTGREAWQLPRVRADIAGWGTAEVLLDSQSVYSKLPAFFMVNDALRRDDNSISLSDGTIFSPKYSSTGGFADPRRKEITILLHSEDVDKKNKPPVAVFIHLVFKKILK